MAPTSNPCLPPEIFDYIVIILCNNPKALKKCRLASKSWTYALESAFSSISCFILQVTSSSGRRWLRIFRVILHVVLTLC